MVDIKKLGTLIDEIKVDKYNVSRILVDFLNDSDTVSLGIDYVDHYNNLGNALFHMEKIKKYYEKC